MNKFLALLVSVFLFLPFSSSALEKGGITMPDSLQAGDHSLVLNGAGIRSKFIFELYVAGLYLSKSSHNAEAILNADAPMAIRLHIISSKITSEKMTKATRSGFEKSMAGDTFTLTQEIEQFISAFSEPIQKGDIFEFIYQEGEGVLVLKNSTEKLIISAPGFKRALFGIWLSDHPVQKKLKKDLLGK